jgi:transposase
MANGKLQVHANLYYKWLKSFMEAGKDRLKGEEKRGATHAEVDELKCDIERLKQLVADLSVDNMVFKKRLLRSCRGTA